MSCKHFYVTGERQSPLHTRGQEREDDHAVVSWLDIPLGNRFTHLTQTSEQKELQRQQEGREQAGLDHLPAQPLVREGV